MPVPSDTYTPPMAVELYALAQGCTVDEVELSDLGLAEMSALLAVHEAEVAAKALSDAAYACFGYQPRITSNQAACEFLSARAARLSSGGEG